MPLPPARPPIRARTARGCLAGPSSRSLSSLRPAAPRRPAPRAPRPAARRAPAPAAAPPPPRVLVDLVEALPSCDVDHRGPLLDAGTDAMVGRFGWARGVPPGVVSVEHDGSTWARFTDRKVQLSFSLLAPTPIFVAARAVGYGAKSASVLLDDQPLGTLAFHREQIRIAQTGTTTLPVDPGCTRSRSASSAACATATPSPTSTGSAWASPTTAPSSTGRPRCATPSPPAAALSGVPHRSLALRAPGSVRCALRFAPRRAPPHRRRAPGRRARARPRSASSATARSPRCCAPSHLEGGEKAAWVDVDLPLDRLRLRGGRGRARRHPGAARRARALRRSRHRAPARAAAAPRRKRAPWSSSSSTASSAPSSRPGAAPPGPRCPALADLAQTGAVFDQHRAPTTVVAAVMASLLTGLPPTAHGMHRRRRAPSRGASAPSPHRPRRQRADRPCSPACRTPSAPSASPPGGSGSSSTRPRAARRRPRPSTTPPPGSPSSTKASADARLFVRRARARRPPALGRDRQGALRGAAAPEYSGLIEPRKAPQTIARMRRSKRAKIVTDADRQRIRALETFALAGQDRALAALVAGAQGRRPLGRHAPPRHRRRRQRRRRAVRRRPRPQGAGAHAPALRALPRRARRRPPLRRAHRGGRPRAHRPRRARPRAAQADLRPRPGAPRRGASTSPARRAADRRPRRPVLRALGGPGPDRQVPRAARALRPRRRRHVRLQPARRHAHRGERNLPQRRRGGHGHARPSPPSASPRASTGTRRRRSACGAQPSSIAPPSDEANRRRTRGAANKRKQIAIGRGPPPMDRRRPGTEGWRRQQTRPNGNGGMAPPTDRTAPPVDRSRPGTDEWRRKHTEMRPGSDERRGQQTEGDRDPMNGGASRQKATGIR